MEFAVPETHRGISDGRASNSRAIPVKCQVSWTPTQTKHAVDTNRSHELVSGGCAPGGALASPFAATSFQSSVCITECMTRCVWFSVRNLDVAFFPVANGRCFRNGLIVSAVRSFAVCYPQICFVSCPTRPCCPLCSGYGSDDDCVKRRVVH